MFEKITSVLEKLNPLKILSSFKESMNKAKEAKDKSFFEKMGIFVSSFIDEMNKVKEEKKEVSEETKKEVAQGADETLKEAKTAMGVEKEPEGKDKENFDFILATSVKNLKSLEADDEANGQTALDKLNGALEGKVSPLNNGEIFSLAAVGMGTLVDLKKKFPTEAKLKEALDLFASTTEKSKSPLSKLFSFDVLKIFKPATFDEKAALAGKFDIDPRQHPVDSMTLLGIKSDPLEDKDEIVKILKEKFFPNSSSGNVGKTVEIINKMLVTKAKSLSTQNMAEFAFLIDDRDFAHLIDLLVGKRETELAKAA